MDQHRTDLRSSAILPIAFLSFGFLVIYLIIRVWYFFSYATIAVDYLFAGLLLIAEGHAIVHATGFAIGVIRLKVWPLIDLPHSPLPPAPPPVTVIIAVRDEPERLVESSLVTMHALDYPEKRILLVDGSTTSEAFERDRAIAEHYGARVHRPRKPKDSKAGSINDAIRMIDTPLIAIFDVDQHPMPNFLRVTVPLLLSDPTLAYVQTPQVYGNHGTSAIAMGAAMQQSIFFEVTCESKQTVNAAFCCGTNVLLRREALLSVGGFDERSVTEDFATSIALHAAGFRSYYHPHALAFGMAPETLAAYLTQQERWATGTIGAIRTLVSLAIHHPKALSLWQWWEYFLSATYYLTGIALLIMLISPVMFLIAGVPTFFFAPVVYLGTFIPYFAFTLTVFVLAMRERGYSLRHLLSGVLLSSLSFPVFLVASIAGLFGKKHSFVVTPKGVSGTLPLSRLWPWHLAIGTCVTALWAGAYRLQAGDPYPIAVNMLWCAYHLFLLLFIFPMNGEQQRVRPRTTRV